MIKRVGYLPLLLIFACGTNDNSSFTSAKHDSEQAPPSDTADQTSEWVFEKVLDQKLIFKNGKSFDTHLYELKYIGQVPVENKAPYLIFSGRDCDGCDENISVYIHSPGDGELDVADGKNRYQYPGRERNYETNALSYEARAFYGQVLNTAKGVIWYQKILLENNSWNKDIFLADITGGKKKETTIKDTGQLQQTLALLKQGKCKEIKGMEYTSEP